MSNRKTRRSLPAAIERIAKKPPARKPADRNLTNAIRDFIREKPHLQWKSSEILMQFSLTQSNVQYHIGKLLKEGSIEKKPGRAYQANPAFKSLEEIRMEIAQLPPRVQNGKSWSSDDHSDAIKPGSNFAYLKQHCYSLRARMAVDQNRYVGPDLEAFDELMLLAFGRPKTEAVQ